MNAAIRSSPLARIFLVAGFGVAISVSPASAQKSGGSITVGRSENAVEASTSGGSINVAMPSNAAFQLDASTSGGSVWTDFPVAGTLRRIRATGIGASSTRP